MAKQMSSREFNQNTSEAKKATEQGPVYITDRGRPAHVLLTYEAYEQLLGTQHLLDRLGEPAGVEDVEIGFPISEDAPQPASFD